MTDLGLKSLGVLCLLAGILSTPAIGQIAPKDTVQKSWFVDIDEAVVTGERTAVKAQDAMRVVKKLDLGEPYTVHHKPFERPCDFKTECGSHKIWRLEQGSL